MAAPAVKRVLYPPVEPFNKGFLKVDELHELYYEESGNPSGNPVLVVHGGPGGGCPPWYRQFFDSQKYRIVMVDQRGSGKSRPSASLVNNTTWHLVADFEKIRSHLSIDKWVVFGGSWGSTLALAYAESHAERVKALVLRGIFLVRRHELTWFYQEGASFIYADKWDDFVAPIPVVERHDLISAYHRRLTGDDAAERLKCARAWSSWEMATSALVPMEESLKKVEEDEFALAFARIENHYFVNGGFFKSDNWLIENVGRIRHLPCIIAQGRYDMVCPMTSAWDLHKAWPEATLRIAPTSGHSCKELEIVDILIQATDQFANL